MRERVVREHLICASCKAPDLDVIPFEMRGHVLADAVVSCPSCQTWYRLEDGLLELLVPALRDRRKSDNFRRRFASRWDGWGRSDEGASSRGDEHKLGQMAFYNEDAQQYETKMLQLPFWKAFDRVYLRHIERIAGGRGTMLEIGGGTGRISLPIASAFDTILSFDIAEEMVRTAMRKRDSGGEALAHLYYFVADAENIPIRTASIDVAVFSGILHHVENPGTVVREVARALVPGGRYIGSENNRSAFRPLFDALMRVNRLWNEKAHEEHFVLTGRELRRWTRDAGLSSTVWTSVFAPPHLFNLASVNAAERLLESTDSVGRAIPWLRHQGGLVLFAGAKLT